MNTNRREIDHKDTETTERDYKEGFRSLWVLCVSVVNFVFIRVHSCPFAVPVFICVNLRLSAVEFSVVVGRRSICGLEFSP
jgi:hypothetical protein